MGTNYYYCPDSTGARSCPHCKQDLPSLHVGKSSMGWYFSLRVHPDEGLVDLLTWEARWMAGGAIFDEYGDRVMVDEMLKVIRERGDPGKLRTHVGYVSPHGGYRDSARYGGPTWDLCDYEFS